MGQMVEAMTGFAYRPDLLAVSCCTAAPSLERYAAQATHMAPAIQHICGCCASARMLFMLERVSLRLLHLPPYPSCTSAPRDLYNAPSNVLLMFHLMRSSQTCGMHVG